MIKDILVVDNDPFMLEFMEDVLTNSGYNVKTFEDGLQALNHLKNNIPDLIFTDLIMPNISGDKLCRAIRNIPSLAKVPLVVISAVAAEEDMDFKAFGADYCIAKVPFKRMGKYLIGFIDNLKDGNISFDRQDVIGLNEIYKREITKELLFSKKHSEIILNHMSEGILELTVDAVIIHANPSAAAIFNCSETSLLAMDFFSFFDMENQIRLKGFLKGVSDSPKEDSEKNPISLNGKELTIDIHLVKQEKRTTHIVILEDVTSRKTAERNLIKAREELEKRVTERTDELLFANRKLNKEINERLKSEEERFLLVTVIENALDGIIIADSDGLIHYANKSFLKMSGLSDDKIIYRYADNIGTEIPEDTFFKQLGSVIRKQESWKGRLTNKHAGVGYYEVEATISPIYDKNGKIENYFSIQRDVSHEVELELQLHHSQKMESLGTLAGGIAHDFNNLLFPITGNSELILADMDENNNYRKNMEEILKATYRARDLVKQILTFSSKTPPAKKPFKVQFILKEALNLLRSTLPSTIDIRQRIDKKCGYIVGNPIQIHQVVVNLATNAFYAMRNKGGVFEVTLKEIEIKESDTLAFPDWDMGPYLLMSVSDTGEGMDKAVIKRIFEPYYTTKEMGEGTGLGLSVVHGIIRGHGGRITVQSELGAGTTFHIYLPVTRETNVEYHVETADDLEGGAERLVVVDDEEQIIKIMERMLTRLGYDVATFTDSEKALNFFQKNPMDVDLVITDYTMPKKTGIDLAGLMLDARPDIKIIMCSGYRELVTEKQCRKAGIKRFMIKPIEFQTLAETVREVLDAP